MSLGRRVVRSIQHLLPAAPAGLRVLCYHLVGAGTRTAVDVPPADFERQMADLVELSTPVPLSVAADPVERPAAGTPMSDATTAVTFDDAYRNFLDGAWPVLLERRIPVTLFVPTGFVSGSRRGPLRGAEDLEPLRWAEIREMLDTGLLTVGAHTATHPDLRALDEPALEAEIRDPRRELEDRLGVAVEAFCYPRALWNARVEAVVKRSYRLAVVGGGRRIVAGRADRYRLPRTSVRRRPPLPIRDWLRSRVWLEEAVSEIVRRRRPRASDGPGQE